MICHVDNNIIILLEIKSIIKNTKRVYVSLGYSPPEILINFISRI